MLKKPNKKGFSLIEMLVVIAIVAVLISIVISIVSRETTKAAAAANAATLRSIEGQVSIHMLEHQGDFVEFTERGEFLNNLSQGIAGRLWDLVFGEGEAAASRAKYNMLYPNSEFQIAIPGSSGIVIPNAVNAKALTAPRRDGSGEVVITADHMMEICVTANKAMAGYNGYNKDDFADIAEDGIYDGASTGNTEEDRTEGEKWVDEQLCKYVEKKHTPGPNCICPYCKTTAHKDGDASSYYERSSTRHGCTGCGNATVFNENHKYDSSTHACSYIDCDVVVDGCQDVVAGVSTRADHKCDICKTAMTDLCTDVDTKDHRCDVCRRSGMGGECGATLTYDDDGHDCSYCGTKKSNHDWESNGARNQADAKHSCKTSGCTYQNIPCTFDDSDDRYCNVCQGGCVTPDTLITLANGTQKRVDELTGEEMLLVWNHNSGSFEAAPVAYIIDHNKTAREEEILKLIFSDGNYVKIVVEHVFFDATVGEYVAITSANAENFIGHSFPAMTDTSNGLHMTELVAVERTVEKTEIYEVVTDKTLTCFTNNVLSGCAYMDGLLNIFEIDVATMAYDAEAMKADLDKYGTINYAFFAPFVSEEMFEMYNGQYMSVAMGKGVLSLHDIMDLIDLHYLYVG